MPKVLRTLGLAVTAMVSGVCVSGQTATPQALGDMSLEDLMNVNVQTASFHSQSAESAPASVSVVTAEEIRKFGYTTLEQALENVRGFYFSYDHTYYDPGIGGFALPGDYATRILVLINGHAMPENIFGSANYFGEDFALDMTLVDRIEIMRGPSSALYGSNGIFATINVITKTAASQKGTTARIESGTMGERKAIITQSANVKGAAMLFSMTVFNDGGQPSIYFPEFDSPATNNGLAVNMDGQRGYRFFADTTIGRWRITAVSGSRQKMQPISFAPTIFNYRGTSATDQRAYLEAAWDRKWEKKKRELRWRTYYDRYRYLGDYIYPLTQQDINAGFTTGYDYNNERDKGDWVGSQLIYTSQNFHGTTTIGSGLSIDIRTLQSVADIDPVMVINLDVNKPDRSANGFVQQEWAFGPKWSLDIGGRYDYDALRHNSFSPRAALIFQPAKATDLKLIYGRGFRNPNESELFFSDGYQAIGNPNLHPEYADNLEIDVDHRIADAWKITFSSYAIRDHDVIVPGYAADGLQTYYNSDEFKGYGAGAELTGQLFRIVSVQSNFQYERASFADMPLPPNAPRDIANLRLSLPLIPSRHYTLAGTLHYVSERRTWAGAQLGQYYLPSLSFRAPEILPKLDFEAGVRNFSNSIYRDPAGLVANVDSIVQPGVTVYFSLTAHFDR